MIITVDMVRRCRREIDGVVVVDRSGNPIVRSAVRSHWWDPLWDGSGGQILVCRADFFASAREVADEQVAAFIARRWDVMVADARETQGTWRP